ncbi:MAG: diguanylate cyclase [Planctomycetota bacterium]
MPSPKRLLLASHHTTRLPAVEQDLRERGLTLFQTSHLAQTLECIARRSPDLIVLAPLAQDPLGYEITQVRELLGPGHHPPLLVVLDEPGVLDTLPGAELPFDDFVCRPLTPTELLARIDIALKRRDATAELVAAREELERQTITDFKTELYNDRYFHQRLGEEFRRARRHHFALSCIVIDFDNFKRINDEYDHPFGDYVLLTFAKKLRSIIRDIDIPARIGGDEFAILLPNTGLDQAVRIADRLRTILTTVRFENRGHSTMITLSIGVDSVAATASHGPEELLQRADLALLEAKRRGRNRICLYQELTGELSRG